MSRLFYKLGDTGKILLVMVSGLLLLSLSRLGLLLWQWQRVSESEIGFELMFQGLRADLIMVSMLMVPVVLLFPLGGIKILRPVWQKLFLLWTVLILTLLLFMELATPAFLMQYDVRPNRLFIEYLSYPKEVISMLWNGFRLSVLASIAGTTLFVVFCYRFYSARFSHFHSLSVSRSLLVWPLLVVIVFLGARSTLGHRPVNPAFFALTPDPMVNSLMLSSAWSAAYAVYELKNEAKSSDMYGKMPFDKALDLVETASHLKGNEFDHLASSPALHTQRAPVKRERPFNLVIVLQESMGGTFIESLGGYQGLTPNLDQLRDKGWSFEHLFATGTRSVRGIEAVVAGFMPTPARSTVKLSGSQRHFATLASVLKSHQYHTEFLYGGEAHFDNMQSFFMGNGFDQITDERNFSQPEFVGSWGVSDEDLFRKAHERLTDLHREDKLFFTLIFTSSNHEPFEFPDGKIELVEQPKASVKNAVKYADYAMGEFFKQAEQADYWKDTLFLVVADHDSRAYGNDLIPVKNFRIPGVILGGDLKPERVQTVASQVDLAPTLLSLMGLDSHHPMLGRDLSNPDERNQPGRAMMQFYNTFAYLNGHDITILRPQQKAVSGKVDLSDNSLEIHGAASPRQAELALAHSLLPSYLYRKHYYNLGESEAGKL